MKILVLAAGEGLRSQEITKNLPKSLFLLNKRKDCTLSLLFQNFTAYSLNDVILVGGYKFDEINAAVKKICHKSCNLTVINADPLYQKGPIYSFLAAKEELSQEKQFLLLPADTIFSPSFFEFITQHNYSSDKCHLFYYKSYTLPLSGSQNLLTRVSNNINLVERIVEINEWKKIYYSKYNYYPVLIPALILPGKIFSFVENILIKGITNVISAVSSYCSLKNKCQAHEFLPKGWIFHDFDTIKDLKKIQSLIENQDQRNR